MTTMTSADRFVTGGVDTHRDFHVAAALDQLGGVLGTAQFPTTAKGYRSLGCWPCTKIAQGADERAGRWIGTSKCGGECGIHTKPLISNYQI